MEAKRQHAPLVVIVGATASGKSALAMALARQFNGEIICADSRTIYKRMDIGTAKPSSADQAEIKHHIIDIVTPDQSFSAAAFKRLALEVINEINSRGKLPIIAGGTGLYIDGVIFDFAFLPPAPTEERERLQRLSVEELQQKLKEQRINLPENSQNPRHLIRALETNGAVPIRKGLRDNTLVVGMEVAAELIRKRITDRRSLMIENGLVEEARSLAEQYGWDAPGLLAPGYKAVREYLDGRISLDDMKDLFVSQDYQLAKRQRTWFRRNADIKWIHNSAQAEVLVKDFLQKAN